MELDEINFFDSETNQCPFPSYDRLRVEAPVWKDPMTGVYMLTRYEDIRAVLQDTETYKNAIGNSSEKGIAPEDPEKAAALFELAEADAQIARMYEEEGWTPAPTLALRDEPDHWEMRRLFDYAFRPAKIKELDPFIEQLADRIIDGFAENGRCEWVGQFAIPFPLFVIGQQTGVPEADMPRIKETTSAWVARVGVSLSAAQRVDAVRLEIEMQHYFQKIFERLRREPDDSFLSVLVNQEVPEWGRPLNENELHAEMMADIFVGGAETTTSALTAGVRLLIEKPEIWEQLRSNPQKHLTPFIEEVLRLESPVQGLFREVAVDVELHGVKIPAGSHIMVRYGAGNRDPEHFTCPADIDLERKQPRSHLAFGVGAHHCLGAPLARRELHFGFTALINRFKAIRFVPGADLTRYAPHYSLRSPQRLDIEFDLRD